ncbi:MAG: alpha/beta hydrolase-fold protein [Flavisolibacter sp.]
MLNQKKLLCLGLLLQGMVLHAQYTVRLVLDQLPSYQKAGEKVYLTGSFNNWNPRDEKFLLQPGEGKGSLTLSLPRGLMEYKFTRGSWQTVESGNGGFPTANRKLVVEGDTTIRARVDDWADHFPPLPRPHTATGNVHVIDTAFYIPQLHRFRRVWVYLPASYSHTSRKYPVLYLQDGQNVFDAATSGYGEWGVDEALDTLGPRMGETIVVAVDHGGDKRINEYAPYDMEKYGRGEGNAYVDFLVKTLRPYINRHYRTRKEGRYNFVAGSSMGGLISLYAILKYPGKFGAAGVISPAFWINPPLKHIDPKMARKIKGRIYFYAGQSESESMVPDMLNVFAQLHRYSKARMETVIRAGGQHNEATWRAEFPLFYSWLFKKQRVD